MSGYAIKPLLYPCRANPNYARNAVATGVWHEATLTLGLMRRKALRFSALPRWPLGMPLVAHVEGDVWEVRTRLDGRIARTLFVAEGGLMILLHAFIKKQQKTPKPELDLAKERLKQLRRRK